MLRKELTFLLALWKANIVALLEYRASFLSQMVGMILNDAAYFTFWLIFFDRFRQVRGWGLTDMLLLFGLVPLSFGAAAFFFGNFLSVANVITSGNLDYYLSLPRPVLLHVLASRSHPSGLGDMAYGLISILLARQFTPDAVARFVLGSLLSFTVFISFLVIMQSLAFWMGSAQMLSSQANNAMVTLASYPITLFDGAARFILLTILPAGLMGTVPVEFVRSFSWGRLTQMLAGGIVFLALALWLFQRGLHRYESGSAIQTQL